MERFGMARRAKHIRPAELHRAVHICRRPGILRAFLRADQLFDSRHCHVRFSPQASACAVCLLVRRHGRMLEFKFLLVRGLGIGNIEHLHGRVLICNQLHHNAQMKKEVSTLTGISKHICPCGRRAYTYFTGGYVCKECYEKDKKYYELGTRKTLIRRTQLRQVSRQRYGLTVDIYRCTVPL